MKNAISERGGHALCYTVFMKKDKFNLVLIVLIILSVMIAVGYFFYARHTPGVEEVNLPFPSAEEADTN